MQMYRYLTYAKLTYAKLTYAGAIPFVVCAFCLGVDIRTLPVLESFGLGSVEQIVSVYALVIASFLAGIHWGQHLNMQHLDIKGSWQYSLPLLSNGAAIILWIGFLLLPFQALIGLFILAFLFFLAIDYRLFQQGLIMPDYFRTRCIVSAIVIASLVVSALSA